MEARKSAWASTGIVGMRNAGATEIAGAVFELGERVRVVDAAGNALTSVPAAIARLTNLTRCAATACLGRASRRCAR